ncbi:MAG: transposase, partial [Clostridia bacterium]|nr:transposase [Clostridia bacterium]
MAIIPQPRLFGWEEIEELGDLERLQLVLKNLPDEELMRDLERERKNGRDDYPVRAVWNSILAGIVYQHPSIESLRRELRRNAQLRQLCGFDPARGEKAVPPAWVYSRFLKKLMAR